VIEDGADAHPVNAIKQKHVQITKVLGKCMRNLLSQFLGIVFVGCAVSGCAPEIVRNPIAYTQVSSGNSFIQLTKSSTIPNYSGAGNTLFVGTRWNLVGDVAHGKVYKSRDSVFFLQGANSHEAYLVISGGKLVGFYLPGEKAWSALEPPIDIEFSVN
jgi:hypothetical protein